MDLNDNDNDYFWNEGEGDQMSMSKFREEAYVNKDGISYVTEAQLHFFMNRPNGERSFNDETQEFIDYEFNCIVHNILYDVSEQNNDEGYMYWNGTGIDYHFPRGGLVEEMLMKAGYEVKDRTDNEKSS